MKNKDGEDIIDSQVSRRTRQWTAYHRLSDKNYTYIPGKYHGMVNYR